MKKFLSVLLAIFMVFSLASCGNNVETSESRFLDQDKCKHENVVDKPYMTSLNGKNINGGTLHQCLDCGYEWYEYAEEYKTYLAKIEEANKKKVDGEVLLEVNGKWDTTNAGKTNDGKDMYATSISVDESAFYKLYGITDPETVTVIVTFRTIHDVKATRTYPVSRITGNSDKRFQINRREISYLGLNMNNISEVNVCGIWLAQVLSLKVIYNDPEVTKEQLAKSKEIIQKAFEKGNGNNIELTMPAKRASFKHKTIQGVECYDVHGYYVPVILGYPKYTE